MKSLFQQSRECVCCGRSSQHRTPRVGEPVIISISFVIYRKAAGKGITKAAPAVRVCEECFGRVLAGPRLFRGAEGQKFLRAAVDSLNSRYSDILSAELPVLPLPADASEELFGGRL